MGIRTPRTPRTPTPAPPFVRPRLGYARVSSADQDPELQIAALQAAGCSRIFVDRASGKTEQRPEFARMLDALRPGDTLVVWRLDRLSRSLSDLVQRLAWLERSHVHTISICEALDTTTPAGLMVAHMIGTFAEFERAIILERTRAGLDSARARGRIGGRPPKLAGDRLALLLDLLRAGTHRGADLARMFDVHPSQISRHAARLRVATPRPLTEVFGYLPNADESGPQPAAGAGPPPRRGKTAPRG